MQRQRGAKAGLAAARRQERAGIHAVSCLSGFIEALSRIRVQALSLRGKRASLSVKNVDPGPCVGLTLVEGSSLRVAAGERASKAALRGGGPARAPCRRASARAAPDTATKHTHASQAGSRRDTQSRWEGGPADLRQRAEQRGGQARC